MLNPLILWGKIELILAIVSLQTNHISVYKAACINCNKRSHPLVCILFVDLG